MKDFLLGVLFLLSSFACFGQDDTADLCYPIGTVWEEGLLQSETEQLEVKHRHTVTGDTLIGGISYKVVVREWIDGSPSQQYTEEIKYFIREDNGLVYYLGKNNENTRTYADITYDGTETLRYNFNWKNGGMDESKFAKVEQIELEDGKAYDYEPSGMVIRTIGNIQGGLILSWMKPSRTVKTVLLSFTRGDVLIYKKDYPLISGINQIEGNKFQYFVVYDLQGRRLQSNKGPRREATLSEHNGERTKSQGNGLPKGVYIQNGRKFVVK